MTKKTLFVDSINGENARLQYEDKEFICPVSLLPKTAQEGDILYLTFEIDKQATDEAKRECEELLNLLTENPSV